MMSFSVGLTARAQNAARVESVSAAARGLRLARLAVVIGIAGLMAACGAPREPGTYLLDDLENRHNLPDADWDSLRSQLPPIPKAADTLPIEPLSVEKNRTFTFGVDPRSISIAPGSIVRYTLYTRSDRGAESVSYESIRCGSPEWRPVATLRMGGGWERPYDDEWRVITRDSVQNTLRAGVFCTGRGTASVRVPDLVTRLRSWERYADATFTDQLN